MTALTPVALRAQTQTPAPSPSPAPTANPTPTPAYSLHGAFSLYSAHTNNVNAVGALDTPTGADRTSRTEIGNALATLTKNTGALQFSVTVGAYALPVIGQSLNTTTQDSANSTLFGYIPLANVSYVASPSLTVTAGKMAALLGQESPFTYQNLNIQRGLGFNAEPTISRGVRATYTQGKFTGNLEANDGYYTGSHRAVEGLLGWMPSANTNLQFAFIAPGAGTPGNVTTSIANKSEYDFMLTQQFGKLQVLPYLLLIHSPAAASLGFTSSESAAGAVMLANYAFNDRYSLAARYESFTNHSGTTDTSANADFLGYGPGSRATTWTFTPAYKMNAFFVRAELSGVQATNFTPGLTFGPAGKNSTQTRALLELGAQF